MNSIIAFVAVIGLSVISANALTVGPFVKLSDGIWDAWNDTNPETTRQGRFGLEYAGDNLFLVSRPLFRQGFSDPWDPASRGGIVSKFRLSNKAWTHTQYGRLDEDKYGDKLFTLNGRLFMLTYGTPRKIVYHKLFFWDDSNGRWLEAPFEIDPAASTVSTNSIAALAVSVPNQTGKVAYFIASAHAQATRGSEIVFSKLNVEFRGNVPIKATLKPIAREQADTPAAVVLAAVKGDKLYALIQNFYSEGYVPETEFAYAVDLKSYAVGNVTLTGPAPPLDYEEDRTFQTDNELLLVGGTQAYGLGQLRSVKDIWALNLSTFQWQNTTATTPANYGGTPTLDQQNKKLYLVGLKEGVAVSQIS